MLGQATSEQRSIIVLFNTTMKAQGLQVSFIHGAEPLCAALEVCECSTHTLAHTYTLTHITIRYTHTDPHIAATENIFIISSLNILLIDGFCQVKNDTLARESKL